MKRYLLFAYNDYYPLGGHSDLQSDHDTLEEGKEAAANINKQNWEIVDTRAASVAEALVAEGARA